MCDFLWPLIEYLWPVTWLSLGGTVVTIFAWFARRLCKSRTVHSLDRTLAALIEARGMSRSLRREGVSGADREELIKAYWRQYHGLPDPPATGRVGDVAVASR